jgi:hypothetical protein
MLHPGTLDNLLRNKSRVNKHKNSKRFRTRIINLTNELYLFTSYFVTIQFMFK